MRQKTVRYLDNIFVSIAVNLVWNFGLWFLLSIILFSGKFSWTHFFNLLSNSYHLFALVILITLIGKWTSVDPKSFLPLSDFPIWRFFQNLFWGTVDILNLFFWVIFDSWRKPSIELFTRMSVNEAVKTLVNACNEEIKIAEINNRNPITGYFGKSYFSLLIWSPTPFTKAAVIYNTILYGKMYEVKKGVFIRAWYRLPTVFFLFVTLWFGGFAGLLTGFLGLSKFAIISIGIVASLVCLLFLIWLGTMIAQKEKSEINLFLKNVFSRQS